MCFANRQARSAPSKLERPAVLGNREAIQNSARSVAGLAVRTGLDHPGRVLVIVGRVAAHANNFDDFAIADAVVVEPDAVHQVLAGEERGGAGESHAGMGGHRRIQPELDHGLRLDLADIGGRLDGQRTRSP